MKKFASIVTLALLSATAVSAGDYNARYTVTTPSQVGEVVQRPAAEVVIADDFVNADTVAVTVVEHSADLAVESAR